MVKLKLHATYFHINCGARELIERKRCYGQAIYRSITTLHWIIGFGSIMVGQCSCSYLLLNSGSKKAGGRKGYLYLDYYD